MVVCSLDSVGLRTRGFHSSEVSAKTRHQLYGVVVRPAVFGSGLFQRNNGPRHFEKRTKHMAEVKSDGQG